VIFDILRRHYSPPVMQISQTAYKSKIPAHTTIIVRTKVIISIAFTSIKVIIDVVVISKLFLVIVVIW
jgi:hypothetical protein